ncbi:MAG: hypothetical protein ACPLPV_04205 [Methanomassiliicoccales archaeon]|jgi:hypothetical protein|uniref:hypothetical protein n=1 Tax=Thermogutta sp. TaxID=1962930 RepID=UPI00321FA00E
MIAFPIHALVDEEVCYNYLLEVLHPAGLHCSRGHPLPADQGPHDKHRVPIVDSRCRVYGAVFNTFTGTIWSKSQYSCATIVLILRSITQGTPTAQLAEELGIDRAHLLKLRHEIQQLIEERLPPPMLKGDMVEADEMYQNAGEKGAQTR